MEEVENGRRVVQLTHAWGRQAGDREGRGRRENSETRNKGRRGEFHAEGMGVTFGWSYKQRIWIVGAESKGKEEGIERKEILRESFEDRGWQSMAGREREWRIQREGG